jgi:hypothetical protein
MTLHKLNEIIKDMDVKIKTMRTIGHVRRYTLYDKHQVDMTIARYPMYISYVK